MKTAKDMFYFIDDIMKILGLSRSKSYKIIRELNTELQSQGIYTIDGRVSQRYFNKRFGIDEDIRVPKAKSTTRQ